MNSDASEIFDYIVVGGGSAGCVVAARLSEDPSLSICLIEAGGQGKSWLQKFPSAIGLILPNKISNWAFNTEKQKQLNGRSSYQPRGKGMGGTSAMNGMIYMRGNPADYDSWSLSGCPGWSYAEVLPYFKKSENNLNIFNDQHGTDGPLPVSHLPVELPLQQTWKRSASECGFKLNNDFNSGNQLGFGSFQFTSKNGERWSAARAFIHNLKNRTNLKISTHSQVSRILFEGKRATGVEIICLKSGKKKIIKCRKEIILCAGAYQSPHLLQLSGVGNAADLQCHNVPIVHHLPGVGMNLHDHPSFTFLLESNSDATLGFSPQGIITALREIYNYVRHRKGLFTSAGVVSGGFVDCLNQNGIPDLQFHLIMTLVDDHFKKINFLNGYSLNFFGLRPKSRGFVKLRSSEPLDSPLIDPQILECTEDLNLLIEGFQIARSLLQTPALKKITKRELYTAHAKTIDEIRSAIRERADTNYHPGGTCKMGATPDCVVDPELRVHGLEGLRVADASVIPFPIGGNMCAPTTMIAEKAAALLLKK